MKADLKMKKALKLTCGAKLWDFSYLLDRWVQDGRNILPETGVELRVQNNKVDLNAKCYNEDNDDKSKNAAAY